MRKQDVCLGDSEPEDAIRTARKHKHTFALGCIDVVLFFDEEGRHGQWHDGLVDPPSGAKGIDFGGFHCMTILVKSKKIDMTVPERFFVQPAQCLVNKPRHGGSRTTRRQTCVPCVVPNRKIQVAFLSNWPEVVESSGVIRSFHLFYLEEQLLVPERLNPEARLLTHRRRVMPSTQRGRGRDGKALHNRPVLSCELRQNRRRRRAANLLCSRPDS